MQRHYYSAIISISKLISDKTIDIGGKVRTFAPYVNNTTYRDQYRRVFCGRIGGLTSDLPTGRPQRSEPCGATGDDGRRGPVIHRQSRHTV